MTTGRDEFDVIDALRARFEAAGARPAMPTSESATMPPWSPCRGAGQVVLATDLVVEGVHVDLAPARPRTSAGRR